MQEELDSCTLVHGGNDILECLNEHGLVNGVSEPGVHKWTSTKSSVDTNTTTGSDTSRAIGG